MIKNRLVMTRLVPELIRGMGVRSVEHYPADLLTSLCELAPSGVSRPTVALLTPGAYNSAFFEHVFLSQQMGIELVEGRDLVCVDHKLYMKTIGGLKQVDVLYRRIDDDFLDPVVFRPDSMLGVPGLTAVLKAGGAAMANAIGTGVADDKAVYAYTPAMIRYYLGEDPILPIVHTHLLRDPEVRAMVLRDLDQFVVKPTGASGGYGVVIGPQASDRELAECRERIEGDPAAFIAQPVIQLSVHPTIIGRRHGRIRGDRAAPHRFPSICSTGGPSPRPAGGAYPGGPARGFANRQFLTGRWQQGHLGSGVLMLRRIADHLFWMARYQERAEWRARLADVNYHLLVESPTHDKHPWAALLAITGDGELFAQYYDTPSEAEVLDFFTFDERNPSSILSCIVLARDNARSLRHLISSELWLEINTLYLDAQGWSPAVFESLGVYDFFADLRNRFHRLAGISHGTLPRDIEFDFLTVGTMLERVENVSRLLDSKYHYLLPRMEDVGGPIDRMQWAAVLRSASALEAYRRVYGNQIAVDQVVEFLLFDPGFPRSARFSLDRMEVALARIEESASRARDPPPSPRLATNSPRFCARALWPRLSGADCMNSSWKCRIIARPSGA